MSLNLDKAVDIGCHAAAGPYMNDAGLEDILRAALEAVGPWAAAQALRDAVKSIGGRPGRGEYYQGMDSAAATLEDIADELDPR